MESAYYRKCIDIRRRITDIEENNDGTRLRITRLNRGIQKMRLERAFLLEQINKHMEYTADDSDRSSSPPPTPTDKPLRSKRSHNRKGTPPPPGSQTGAGGDGEGEGAGSADVGGPQEQQQPQLQPPPPQEGGSPTSQHHQPQTLHPINPRSSAQSTPDPTRQAHSYFGPAATSPHAAVNGAPVLPLLHSLPPLQPPQQAPPRAAYFDPAYDEQRPAPSAVTEAESGRRRAYSGEAPPQNGDTEMTDAGFTAVNR